MKIGVAQTKPFAGDLASNIARHEWIIRLAVRENLRLVLFSELSLTGYEPRLAGQLATGPEDERLTIFQQISDASGISIGLGLPTMQGSGTSISLVFFHPRAKRLLYSKKYLHSDEEPFFISTENFATLEVDGEIMAPAICHEISIAAHAERAAANQAAYYLASVAKTQRGVEQAFLRLSDIAKRYGMTVFMSNAVGPADDFVSAGQSAVWKKDGSLAGQLDDNREGLLVWDTVSQSLKPVYFEDERIGKVML